MNNNHRLKIIMIIMNDSKNIIFNKIYHFKNYLNLGFNISKFLYLIYRSECYWISN